LLFSAWSWLRDRTGDEVLFNGQFLNDFFQKDTNMAYDEERAKRSRVVVETPNARREVYQSEAVRPERDGISSGMIGVLVIVAMGLVTLLVLFMMTGRTNEFRNDELAAQQPAPVPQTTIIEQPAAQQPPVIIQQPAPAQPAPVIIQQPAPGSGAAGAFQNDVQIQAEIDRQIAENETFSGLGITATVVNGKVTLLGTVRSESLKMDIERMARDIIGVLQVDNQILVSR
jgi:cytoskeletal protein RodZ